MNGLGVQEASSAQYIMQQYIAATGGAKLQSSVHNFFAAGKVKMLASEYETASKLVRPRSTNKAAEVGWFNVWQSSPNMWLVDVELEAEGQKVHVSAGCDGKLVWRHTPWLGAHASKGPVRPLRRVLQVQYSNLCPPPIPRSLTHILGIGVFVLTPSKSFVERLALLPSQLPYFEIGAFNMSVG